MYFTSQTAQDALDNFFSKCMDYSLFMEKYNNDYGEVSQDMVSTGGTIHRTTYLMQFQSQDNDALPDELPSNVARSFFGSGYSNDFESFKIEEEITFPVGGTLPKPCEVRSQWQETQTGVMGAIFVDFYDLKKKYPDFPDWIKDVIIDTNIRVNRSDKKVDFLVENLMTPSILDSLKAIINSNVKYVFDNSSGTKESMQLLEDYARINTQLNLIDAGLDAWSLVREAISQIIELITDYYEMSRLDRMEKRENEIKELLTDEEKLNRLLGDALNVGKSIDGYVVPYSESLGGYDFTRFIDISDNQDGSWWLSKQVLLCLQLNWQFGEEF